MKQYYSQQYPEQSPLCAAGVAGGGGGGQSKNTSASIKYIHS